MISNEEDGIMLTEFLRSLFARTGPITAKYFMSDDAEQYYSSRKVVYGQDSQQKIDVLMACR